MSDDTQTSEFADNYEKKNAVRKIKLQNIITALQFVTIIFGAFVGLALSKYLEDFWNEGFFLCAIIAIAWAISFVGWILLRDIDKSINEFKGIRDSCNDCKSKCTECADTIRSINDSEGHNDTQLIKLVKTIHVVKVPQNPNDYTCEVEVMQKIRNDSDQTLEKYKYGVTSDTEIDPTFSDIKTTLKRDGEEAHNIDAKLGRSVTVTAGKITGYNSVLDFEPAIMPGSTAVLNIRYNSSSFNKLFIPNKHEHSGLEINYKTHELKMVIKLSDELSKKYNLSISTGKTYNWEIKDVSQNHMRKYEIDISKSDQLPKLSPDKKTMTWKVQNPKVACVFRLYFSLEKID